ncbi:MAG: tRNA-binding protein [Oscillospiraceae bacterium]|nr:tRNA-binding protein [Oscillospiraceae bacterium]
MDQHFVQTENGTVPLWRTLWIFCFRCDMINGNKSKAERTWMMINIEDFDKVEMRAGTVLDVTENKKSRNPAYVVTIDFGEKIGIKKSSAQITALYKPENLIGRQIICCVNLEPMHIGSVKSEVRILGTDSRQGVVLLTPTETVENGDRVF